MADGQGRGIYRNDCFNGLTEYHVYDSNKCLLARVEILAGFAGKDVEERMNDWLDAIDPVSPEGETITSASASEHPPSVRAA
jgi:hypothetical protein